MLYGEGALGMLDQAHFKYLNKTSRGKKGNLKRKRRETYSGPKKESDTYIILRI